MVCKFFENVISAVSECLEFRLMTGFIRIGSETTLNGGLGFSEKKLSLGVRSPWIKLVLLFENRLGTYRKIIIVIGKKAQFIFQASVIAFYDFKAIKLKNIVLISCRFFNFQSRSVLVIKCNDFPVKKNKLKKNNNDKRFKKKLSLKHHKMMRLRFHSSIHLCHGHNNYQNQVFLDHYRIKQ